MINFLNPLFLWGTLAALIPILIHLWSRERYRTELFPALEFILSSYRRSTKKILLQQYLLLFLRTLIILLLALALARPVINYAAGAGGPIEAVIILDNSASMGYARAGVTAFARAKEAVKEVLALPVSKASLITSSERHLPPPSSDLNLLRERLLKADLSYRPAGLLPAVAIAAEGLRLASPALPASQRGEPASQRGEPRGRRSGQSVDPNRVLLVLTDLQKTAWRGKVKLPPNLRILVVDVGSPDPENAAVRPAESLPFIGLKRPVKLAATLANFGRREREVVAELFIDGEGAAKKSIRLEAGAENKVIFYHNFGRAGTHEGRVKITGDALPGDDARRFNLWVEDAIPVLLVDGVPSAIPFKGETFYLKNALTPFAVNNPFVVSVATPRKLPDLSKYRVVILANVAEITLLAKDRLTAFVNRGGGLLVFSGDKVNPQAYRDFEILGAEIKGMVEGLFSLPGEEWERVRFSRYTKLVPKLAEKVKVGARFDNGDPLIVERAWGKGKVIVTAFPADADGSNLPLRPQYLPRVQQMVFHLGGQGMPALAEAPGNFPPDESDLRRISEGELKDILRGADVRIIPTDPALISKIKEVGRGFEITWLLLVAAFITFLVEGWVASF